MDSALWTLFFSAFLSSTLLPGGSEAILLYTVSKNDYTLQLLILIAGAGNTLGGMSSWLIGRLIAIKYSAQNLLSRNHQAAVVRVQRWGGPVLLLSWLPIVGDPLCVAAGWLRFHWLYSLLFIASGKLVRYTVIVYIANAVSK